MKEIQRVYKMRNVDTIIEALRKEGARVTSARKTVAKVLLKNKDTFLSAEEVFNNSRSLEKGACDQVSVYRTLKLFEKMNIIRKKSFQGEADRYQLGSSKKGHEHFFKCDNCLETNIIKGCVVAKVEKGLASQGYSQLYHHLEVRGLCPRCSSC